MPFFIERWLGFGSGSEVIAIVPIVNMGTGLITTFFLKRVNKHFGRRTSYISGAVAFGIGLVIIWFMPQHSALNWLIYIVSFFFGVGQTTTLVGAITMEADLVGTDVKSSAFVYGFISCLEKLGTGAAIISTSYLSTNTMAVRTIEIFLPTGALTLGIIIAFTIVRYWRSTTTRAEREKLLKKQSIQQ